MSSPLLLHFSFHSRGKPNLVPPDGQSPKKYGELGGTGASVASYADSVPAFSITCKHRHHRGLDALAGNLVGGKHARIEGRAEARREHEFTGRKA